MNSYPVQSLIILKNLEFSVHSCTYFIFWVKRESHKKPGQTIMYCFILSNLEMTPLTHTFIASFWVSRVGRGFTCIFLERPSSDSDTTFLQARILNWKTLIVINQFSSVQSLSRVRLFATPWIAACQAFLSITISPSSYKLMSIESVMPSSHLILCRPLFLLPPIPPSIRVFSNESTLCMRWPKYWSFSFSIIPSREIPGLISFRMDWLDFLEVQGILKSLLQRHSSQVSILRRSAFFTVQLSHSYMATEKT